MRGQAGEHFAEVSVGIDPAATAAFHHGVDDGAAFPACAPPMKIQFFYQGP